MSRPGMAESEWIPLTKPTDLAIRREQVSSFVHSLSPMADLRKPGGEKTSEVYEPTTSLKPPDIRYEITRLK